MGFFFLIATSEYLPKSRQHQLLDKLQVAWVNHIIDIHVTVHELQLPRIALTEYELIHNQQISGINLVVRGAPGGKVAVLTVKHQGQRITAIRDGVIVCVGGKRGQVGTRCIGGGNPH